MKFKKVLTLTICLAMLLGMMSAAKADSYPYYSEIFVTKNPTKMDYTVGESFDPDGLELSGRVWRSPTETDINLLGTSKMKFSPSKFTSAGTVTVTLSMDCKAKSGSYETFTTTLQVSVKQLEFKIAEVTEEELKPSVSLPLLPKVTVEKPKLTKSPTDEDVAPGGKCSFIARADNTEKYVWHFVDTNGKEYTASQAKKQLSGLGVSGANAEKLKLSKIPLKMNGWKVYCEFKNSAGTTESDRAVVYVNDPDAAATPAPTPVPTMPAVEPHSVIPVAGGNTQPVDGTEKDWICSACGRLISGEANFCPYDATKRPEGEWICPICGRLMAEDTNFCPYDAAKRPTTEWTCPTCGKVNPEDANFCPNDGTKRPEGEWTCPKCGKVNPAEVNFCPNDATAKP